MDLRRRGKHVIQDDVRPLSDAEVAAFKRQINSPLLKRFLRTIDDLHEELADRERQIELLRNGSHRA